MSLTNADSVSLSGNTSMFESVKGGGKKGKRKSKGKPKNTYSRKTRSLKRKSCSFCKKKKCASFLCGLL